MAICVLLSALYTLLSLSLSAISWANNQQCLPPLFACPSSLYVPLYLPEMGYSFFLGLYFVLFRIFDTVRLVQASNGNANTFSVSLRKQGLHTHTHTLSTHTAHTHTDRDLLGSYINISNYTSFSLSALKRNEKLSTKIATVFLFFISVFPFCFCQLYNLHNYFLSS